MAEKRKLQDRIDEERHQCNLLYIGVKGLKIQWNTAKKQLSQLKMNCKEDKNQEGSCKWERLKEKQVAALRKNIDDNVKKIEERKASIAKLEEQKKALGISQLKL